MQSHRTYKIQRGNGNHQEATGMAHLPHVQAFLVTGMATTRSPSVSFTQLIVSASRLLLTGKPVHPDRSGTP